MTDTLVERVARAIEEAEAAWLLQNGDALDGLQEGPPLSLPETVARAAIEALRHYRLRIIRALRGRGHV